MDVIAIFGPTGVGKTDVAVALASRLSEGGESPVAVSADAIQVYRGLETLSGVASEEQQRQLEHRLIGILEVSDSFSAGRYAQLAHTQIDDLLAEGRRPIVIGGTGLYLRAALTDLDLNPPAPPGLRERRIAQLQSEGPAALHAELTQRAPWAATEVDPGDSQRLVRYLELLDAGTLRRRDRPSQLWTAHMRRPTLLAGLTMDREQLYKRIEARVEAIVAAGAREEVQRASASGASHTARKALGFAELLEGDVDAMKQRTRNYAKRQLTWMRKLAGLHPIDVTRRGADDVAAEIEVMLRGRTAESQAPKLPAA